MREKKATCFLKNTRRYKHTNYSFFRPPAQHKVKKRENKTKMNSTNIFPVCVYRSTSLFHVVMIFFKVFSLCFLKVCFVPGSAGFWCGALSFLSCYFFVGGGGWSLDAHPCLSCLAPARTGAPELPRSQCPPFDEVALARPALVTEGSGRPPRRVTPGGISVRFCLNACSEVKDKRRVCLLVLCILMCILLGHRYMCKCV